MGGCGVGLLAGYDGEGEGLAAEDGVEADEASVGGEQDEGHAGGERQVGGVGAYGSSYSAAAEDVACEAEDDHAKSHGDEGAAEEAHGSAGEIEDVAEGEVVELGVAGEEV